MNSQVIDDPLEGLRTVKSVFIKQTVEMADMIAGCENPNRFKIYFKDTETNKYSLLFSCKEMSNYFIRNCLSGNIKPMQMNIKHIKSNKIKDDNFKKDDNYIIVSKSFQSSCLSCNISTVIHFKNNSGPIIGKIIQKFTFTNPIFYITNSIGRILYTITTECCKCGFIFKRSCRKYKSIILYIYEGENITSIQDSVGKISHNNIMTALNVDECYEIVFPEKATIEDKLSFISVGLMIYYIYFEENSFNI